MVVALANSLIPPAFLPPSGGGAQESRVRDGVSEKSPVGGGNQEQAGEEGEEDAAVAGLASSQDDGPPLDVIMADEVSVQSGADFVAASRLPTFKPQNEEESEPPLATPPLDDMIERIPPLVRETLEELFRARFVKVVRVPKSALASDRKATA